LTKLAASHAVRIIAVDTQRLDGLTGHARHQESPRGLPRSRSNTT
jgi:hypothetical protein